MKHLALALSAVAMGRWAVEVTTLRGPCDRTAMAYVEINEEEVRMAPTPFSQGGSMPLAGILRKDGSFSARLGAIQARGRMEGTRGTGTWRSLENDCGGYWRAWKR